MDLKLRDYIGKNAIGLIGLLPLDIEDETLSIKDSYQTQRRKYIKYQINACEEFLKIKPDDNQIEEWRSEYIDDLRDIERTFPIPTLELEDLTNSINKAFFKVESFMNGSLKSYEYFGFYDAFMVLFELARKPKNWTIENCEIIGHYWNIIQQIRVDFYQGHIADNFPRTSAFDSDYDELLELTNCVEEFNEFTTQKEIDEYNRRDSILDIWKPERIEYAEKASFLTPTFREEVIPDILKILKPFFSLDDWEILKGIIERGQTAAIPIVFKGNANALCDFFKQLLIGQFIIIGLQKHLEAWIHSNFAYSDSHGNVTELKTKYIGDFISGSKRPTKNKRLIDVRSEGGKNSIVQVLRNKTAIKHRK